MKIRQIARLRDSSKPFYLLGKVSLPHMSQNAARLQIQSGCGSTGGRQGMRLCA
jgi:hypothetical protein